jgi:hypothetical protein
VENENIRMKGKLMMLEINAKVVSYTFNEDENYRMIAIGDDPDDPDNYIILQTSIVPDEQDKELGIDGYYIELNGQEQSGYNLCQKVYWESNRLVFEFDIESCSTWEFNSVTIDLSGSIYDKEKLEDELKTILGTIYNS